MILDPILLSGPHTTHLDVEFAAEAAAIGWGPRGAQMQQLFRQEVARRARQRFALAVSSSHAALLLSLLSLKLPPGSEVLVPEIADITLPAAVLHAGARPVFCDVDPKTLCLSPQAAAARITPRTRAVIPFHLFGRMCEMGPLLQLAQARKIVVLEYATQGLGASWREHPAGEFGLFSLIGFESTAAVTAGGGAVLLSSRQDLMAQAERLALRVTSPNNAMVAEALSFDYGMSTVQASLGYAQMQRLDELLEGKRKIFSWYRERLEGVPGIRLSEDEPGIVHSHLLTMAVLEEPARDRRAFLEALAASGVMAAPVYLPLSGMPMFTRQENPVAYSVGGRALLLPSGNYRTEEEVDYVCAVVRQLLADKGRKKADVLPGGWLLRKSEQLERIQKLKQEGLECPFEHKGKRYALRVLTAAASREPEMVALFADLRKKNQQALLSHLPESEEDVRNMMRNYAETNRDFLLFLVVQGTTIWGHLGLDSFDFQENSATVEALMMREDAPHGLGIPANHALHVWAREDLKLDRLYAHIVGSNKRSRLLASTLGFKDVNQVSLYLSEENGGTVLRPLYVIGKETPADSYVLSCKDMTE